MTSGESGIDNEGMHLASRMSRLGTETAFQVLAQAKVLESEGKDIVHLEIGEPDFDTPGHIVESAIQALQDGWHHYTPAAGILELREAIAREISDTRRISVDPDQVVVTPGAKPIIFFTLLALVESGDEVIYPNPGFPIYESMIECAGARAVAIPLREQLDFRLDIQELLQALTPRTRVIILNSPSNPTGSVLSGGELTQLAEVLVGREIVVLSDEIYSHILYQGEHQSIASLPGMKERTIILDGFSKTYAMTGWRLGYGVMPAELAEQMAKLMINSNSCTAAFTQVAGIAALESDQTPVTKMVETFRERRDHVVKLLNQIEGITCQVPLGAFYVFPRVSDLGLKSSELERLLLHEAGVAALSGTAFGEHGEGYLRISYATSLSELDKGVERIAQAARKLQS